MARLNQRANILRDKSGSAVLLLGLLWIFCLFIFSMFILDFMVLKTNMEKSKDAVTAACLAAVGEINREALGYNIIEIDEIAAEATFIEYLNINLEGIVLEPPIVEEFVVYNTEDLPATCPAGKIMDEPSIHTLVQLSVSRPALVGLFGGNYTFKIHFDCDNTLE